MSNVGNFNFLCFFQLSMAAEDSEKLARRLQAEEDSIAEILFHGVADNAIGRQLSTENELEDKSKHARPTKNQDHDNIPIPTPTHNNHILSDEALARLLQAEEDQRARDSVQTEASCSHSSSTLPPMSHVDSDEALARRLQAHDQQDTPNDRPNEDISNDLELFSPTPDVHALFRAFDLQYFDGMLRMVEVGTAPLYFKRQTSFFQVAHKILNTIFGSLL